MMKLTSARKVRTFGHMVLNKGLSDLVLRVGSEVKGQGLEHVLSKRTSFRVQMELFGIRSCCEVFPS